MSEDRLEKIEAKIDLLYRILIQLEVGDIGRPYGYKYLQNFSKELMTLFDIKVPQITRIKDRLLPEKLETEFEKINQEYLQLNTKYEEKNYLVKDEEKVKSELKSTKKKYDKSLSKVESVIKLGKIFIEFNQIISSIVIYLSLREKLGIKTYQEDISKSFEWELDDLVKQLNYTLGDESKELLVNVKKLLSENDLKELIILLRNLEFNDLAEKISSILTLKILEDIDL